ncbi:MAG: dTDP-4-dehydrorhamnose reductase [Bacteroidota bacterium]|jgi:dTDP-4-dehydrorhamnose reductase
MKKILVTGANGQLGKELRDLAAQFSACEFLFLSREDMPIHHFELVRHFFDQFKPDFCINCAAYTAVDKAESETELAKLINAESVGILSAVAAEADCRFVHISTDYVYSGDGSRPYVETDPTRPLSVYGKTKLDGEIAAIKNDPLAVIIRTSWVYSVYGHNFVKTMLRLMKDRPEIRVVSDQIGSPTYAADLAFCIMHIIGSEAWHPGVYNFSNEGEISWFEFALEIGRITGSSCVVHPIPTSAYPTPAQRPLYSVMDKHKICETFGIELKNWKESLLKCINNLNSSNKN